MVGVKLFFLFLFPNSALRSTTDGAVSIFPTPYAAAWFEPTSVELLQTVIFEGRSTGWAIAPFQSLNVLQCWRRFQRLCQIRHGHRSGLLSHQRCSSVMWPTSANQTPTSGKKIQIRSLQHFVENFVISNFHFKKWIDIFLHLKKKDLFGSKKFNQIFRKVKKTEERISDVFLIGALFMVPREIVEGKITE